VNFTNQYYIMCDCNDVQSHGFGPARLPLQHDVQSWIFQYGSCQYKLLTDFYEWCKEYRKTDIKMVKGCTLEELWLMFYMWRDHYKIWDGKKWIKE